MARPSVRDQWDHIYARGEQHNRYPFDSVVSFIYRFAPRDRDRGDVKVLEVGCGVGNNLWFAAREGFDVFGFDGSSTAVNLARQRFDREGLKGNFIVADFTHIPYEDETFDMVVDRGALACVAYDDMAIAVAEVHRTLRPGGFFFFTPYSDRHTSALGPCPWEEYVTPVQGNLVNNGTVSFLSRGRVCSLMASWELLSMTHTEVESVLTDVPDKTAFWTVVARKRA